ncbi:MAG: hypothetical protein IH984_10170 [Planctomycetes bacterium]|nr:hypothetical protein [Planctomycetota bacterium]
MAQLINATKSTLRAVVFGAYIVGLVFCGAGIWLVYLGAAGSTEVDFFGLSIASTNVGIVAIFLGAAIVVLLVIRSLRTLEKAIGADSSEETRDSAPSIHWPKRKTRKTLEQKVKALSDTQWMILMAIAETDGISKYTLMEKIHLGPSIFSHRLHTLRIEELVTQGAGNLYVAAKIKRLLGKSDLRELRQ